MNPTSFVPVLPESAPFTAEQRAYLNGFLAGLFSRSPVPGAQPNPAPSAKPLTPLTILFGSQTGTAEGLAKRISKEAGKRGFAPTIHEMAKYPTTQLASEKHLLVVTSTYGDGEPPDNAKSFWEFLSNDAAPKSAGLRFSVCALGDTNYPKFCAFGKALDERLEKTGATRVSTRVDCDLDYEESFVKWLDATLAALGLAGVAGEQSIPYSANSNQSERASALSTDSTTTEYSRKNPFPAPLVQNRKLNSAGSEKDTRHFAFSLVGSGLSYEAGDALGIRPQNDPVLVDEIVHALDARGHEEVPGKADGALPLREALMRDYEITRIPQPFLKAMAEKTSAEELRRLTAPGVNGELTKFLWGREIIDLLLAHPTAKFTPTEFVSLLKKLQPRLYSIASSPKAHLGEVHLCVGVVRYQSLGRARGGVASTFLAERVESGATVPAFIHTNKHFRPPEDPARPMILVGPGTGIAPFRAFLEERKAIGAKGRNWLFFGDQRSACDFLYRDEIDAMQRDGVLTRFDAAFSRDQVEKIYVQNRMLEHAGELFAWLEEGGHFYVCGDAKRMAKDVDAALHKVIELGGGRNSEQAAEYVQQLKSQGRYQRDVY